jgi:hypothetical protein
MAFGLCDLHTELEIYIFMCMYYKMFMCMYYKMFMCMYYKMFMCMYYKMFIGFTMLSGKSKDYIGICFLFFRVRSL